MTSLPQVLCAIGLALLMSACTPSASHAPSVVSMQPPAASAAAPASVPAPTPLPPAVSLESTCAELAREHAGALAGTSLASLADKRGTDPQFLPSEFGRCLRTPGGAWAIVITAAAEDPPADVACWAVVHVDESGRRAQAFPAPNGGVLETCRPKFDAANLVYGQLSSVIFSPPALWDQDHDGEPELLVHREGTDRNQELVAADTIWSFKAGAVEPYGPARSIGVKEWRDVDGDGVRDIITHGAFRSDAMPACGLLSMVSSAVVGPQLLAHGLADGSFSLDDAEAKEFARKQCASRPVRIGGRNRSVGIDIGCALLWGVPPKDRTSCGIWQCARRGPGKRTSRTVLTGACRRRDS